MSTAVILAGGQSRRMKTDKMALSFQGKTFLEAALERFSACFDTVWVSLADPGKYPNLKAERLADIVPGRGPISGLHAALRRTSDGGVFLVAGDMPFSDPRAALRVTELSRGYDIAAAAGPSGRPEPLFAYYAKSVLPLVEEAVEKGENKLSNLFPKARLLVVTPAMLGDLWDERLLLNVNTPEDYEALSALFPEKGPGQG